MASNQKTPLSLRCAPRHTIAWMVIALIVAGVVGAILYNINAIMMLFDKGSVSVRNFDDLQVIVSEMSDQYEVTKDTVDGNGNFFLQYKTKNEVAQLSVTADANLSITEIKGTVDLAKFEPTQITKLYSMIDSLLKPICVDRDILAAEIGLLKASSSIHLVRFDHYVYAETFFDEKFITVRKEEQSFVFVYTVTML